MGRSNQKSLEVRGSVARISTYDSNPARKRANRKSAALTSADDFALVIDSADHFSEHFIRNVPAPTVLEFPTGYCPTRMRTDRLALR